VSFKRAFALAVERDAKVHTHLSEGPYEPEHGQIHFGVQVSHQPRSNCEVGSGFAPARCPPTCPPPLTSHNLAEQLLLWRNPQHLRDVMCAGRGLLRDGEVVGVDEATCRWCGLCASVCPTGALQVALS